MVHRVLRFACDNPYVNLAAEAWFTGAALPGQRLLLLWQNTNTVVIGRNQNPLAECDLPRMRQDGVRLARRLSGGGAVYHHTGNLNFSFIAPAAEQDTEENYRMVLTALQDLGLLAKRSGRNDLALEGRKISGSAFFEQGGGACHHGTLLVCEDTVKLGAYLRPSAEKLQSKGVASVPARVTNLAAHCPGLSTEQVSTALSQTFAASAAKPVAARWLSERDLLALSGVAERAQYLASESWLYGASPGWNKEFTRRFAWGSVSAHLSVARGEITGCRIFTDHLSPNIFAALEQALPGTPWHRQALQDAVTAHCPQAMQADLQTLFDNAF